MKERIEQIIEANARWMSGPGQNADPAEYASVAASTAQLVQALQDEKETAGDATVSKLLSVQPTPLVSGRSFEEAIRGSH